MKTLFMILAMLSVVFFCSCKKNHTTDLKPNLNVADNIVIAEEAYNHIVLMTIRSLRDPLLLSQGYINMDSGYVSYDSLKNKITFYYFNKLSPDSISRGGQVEVIMSGNLLVKGSWANVRFTNYYSDRQLVSGKDSMVNTGLNTGGKMVIRNFINEGVITQPCRLSILWQSSNQFKADPSVFNPGTANYYVWIAGDASGISSDGYSFTAVTNDSLIYWSECPWLEGDKIKMNISGVDIPTGTIIFNATDHQGDDLEYDFEGNVFYSRMNCKFLKH